MVRGEPAALDRPRRLARPLRRPELTASRDAARTRAPELVALAAAVAGHVVLLTRLLHARTIYDEGVYLASLDALRHGQALGRDVFAPQPPGFYLLLEGIGAVTGVSVAGVRAGIVAVDALGVVFAFLLARRLAGPLAGVLAAGLIAIAPLLPIFGGRVWADPPAMSLTVGALWLAASRRPVWAGALLAAAVLVKFSVLTAAPTFLALLLLERGRVRALVAAAAGAVAVLGVVALVYVRDLTAIWSSAVAYHEDASSIEGLVAVDKYVQFFSPRAPYVWLVAAGVAATAVAWRRAWPLWLWAVAATVFVLEHKPLHDNHLLVLPYAFALPAAVALGWTIPRLPRRAAAVAAATALLALAGGWVQQLHRVNLEREPEDAGLVAAAHRLERLTRPDELVVSDQPIVAVLAGRRVPGPLVDTAQMRFDTGSLTPAKVLRVIDEEHVPAVVVGRALAVQPGVLRGLRERYARREAGPAATIWFDRRR